MLRSSVLFSQPVSRETLSRAVKRVGRGRELLDGSFGGFFQSEALAGALPRKQNSPQRPPYGLHVELVSGSAFTAPRAGNRYAWLYRIRPSVQHSAPLAPGMMVPWRHPTWTCPPFSHPSPPLPFRFRPLPRPPQGVDFVDGAVTIAANGHPAALEGVACCTYALSASMSATGRYMRHHEGDVLILPQEGDLVVRTEFGDLDVGPLELVLVPRGTAFQVDLPTSEGGVARGYFLENFGDHFVVPELGPIGISGGLAHPRHFRAPRARYDDPAPGEFELVTKFGGVLFRSPLRHSPFDVVAWYGNAAPCWYDLRLFNAVNTVTYDHPDPSINTVLSSYSASPGVANVDFVIFPPRWLVAENSFRPPFFHRNTMSEFMGLIRGSYDAKPQSFEPGSSSVHNRFIPHGPDAAGLRAGTELDSSKPERYSGTMAFMWETRLPLHPTQFAMQNLNETDYSATWEHVPADFDPANVPPFPEPYPFDGS